MSPSAAIISPLKALRAGAAAAPHSAADSLHLPFAIRHSPFASASWLNVLHDTYDFAPCTIAGPNGVILPMMEVSSPFTGRRGISLPFTDEVLGPDSQLSIINSQLLQQAIEHGRARNWKYIEIRGGHSEFSLSSVASCKTNPDPSPDFYGHSLDLTPGEAALFAGLDSSVRRAIRKAENASIKVEIADSLEAVRDYYKLHCRTRRRHGLPPQPWSFFANIHRHMISAGQGMVVIARLGKAPIAASLFLHSQLTTNNQRLTRGEAVYKFGASDDRFQSLRPNNLVMWEAIKYYADCGFSVLRLGRTDLNNEGLRRFKLGWGAIEYPIHYWRYDLRRNRFISQHSTTHSQLLNGWHNHVFRLAPVWLSRCVGALLYKHIA